MKAAILNNLDGTFQIEEIEIDVPRGREVLVEVKASGLCHSDLHFAEQDFGVPLPAVLGHELAGVVLAVGPEVREFSVGDHVVGSLIQFCGHCRACIGGRTYQCTRPEETLRDDPNHMHRLTRDGEGVAQGFGTGAFADARWCMRISWPLYQRNCLSLRLRYWAAARSPVRARPSTRLRSGQEILWR